MGVPLGVELDPESGVPFYRQIINRVLMAISDGRLRAGDQLPTVRQLAVDLHVNPNTVARAYKDLELVGVIDTRRGLGTFVAERRPRVPVAERRRQLEQLVRDLTARAQELGFDIGELIETLNEHRRSVTPGGARPAGGAERRLG